jgi:protease-4
MATKKHSILTVLMILGVVAVFLGVAMAFLVKLVGQPSMLSLKERIGVIPIEGPITDAEPILTQLVDFGKDKRIKAIILRINSPGGGVAPSQEIYREVRRTIDNKKVVAHMGSLAASGGYYIASAANKIVANPGTITGSIGVIVEFVQLEELLEKIGVGLEVLKSGEFKDIGSPHRKVTKREKELMQDLIADIQEQFVNAVAEGRSLSVDAVKAIADGRILTGSQAKEKGLVDLLGNFRDTVNLTKEMVGLKGEVTLVYPEKPKPSLWDYLFRDATDALDGVLRNHLGTRIEYRWSGLQPHFED